MAKIYYRKIKDADINYKTGMVWTIDDVPIRWQDEVQTLLNNDLQG